MDLREFAKKIAPYLPAVKDPDRPLSFQERLKYTLFVLVSYYLLSVCYLLGLSRARLPYFEYLSQVLAARIGTLITLGIGPIITAAIIWHIFVSSGMVRLDLRNPEDRIVYEVIQKFLAIFFIIYENAMYIFGGILTPERFAPFPIPELFLLLQLTIGGIILLLLDEVCGKYGIGSGISLFIAAGVAKDIVVRMLYPLPPKGLDIPSGRLWVAIINLFRGNIWQFFVNILPIITTIIIFLIVTYFWLVRIEMPLLVRTPYGTLNKWPIPLFYTSVIPVIFAVAFLAVLQQIAIVFWKIGFPILGSFEVKTLPDGRTIVEPISGFISIINHPTLLDFVSNPSLVFNLEGWLRLLGYFIYFLIAGIIFSIMWIEVTEQNPEKIAELAYNQVFLVPGVRPNKKLLTEIIRRYIYPTAILGGALIGVIAALANFLGALVSGTAVLLLVTIIYEWYYRVIRQFMQEAGSDIKSLLRIFGIRWL